VLPPGPWHPDPEMVGFPCPVLVFFLMVPSPECGGFCLLFLALNRGVAVKGSKESSGRAPDSGSPIRNVLHPLTLFRPDGLFWDQVENLCGSGE